MSGPEPAPRGRLTGRVALVTGAATGIGRACARALADDGATVIPVGLDPPEATADRPAGYETVDVTDGHRLAALHDTVAGQHGKLDILVNNAGVYHFGSVEHTPPDEWQRVLAVNLTGPYLVSRALLPLIRAAGAGAILHIASVHAVASVEGHAAYAASKGGLVALTRQMAIDYAADRIRVNALLVGSVATAMSAPPGVDPAVFAAWRDPTRIGRLADPDEVAHAVCFLASDDASFITGAAIPVDGGLLARLAV